MTYYRHTQPGWAIIVSMGLAVAIQLWLNVRFNLGLTYYIIAAALALMLILFASLTVEIDDIHLRLRFGPGLIRKRFRLSDIEAASAVRNRWWHGWGIHLSPGGWLFNVSGFDAVEIRLKGGKRYRIGTDVPHELERAIGQAIYQHDPKFYKSQERAREGTWKRGR